MLTFKIIAHDGTLFPTRAKYKGCTWFAGICSCIEIHHIISKVKRQILYRLNHLNKVNLDKAFKIKWECHYIPENKVKKPPRVELLCMKLGFIDEKPSQNQINTAMLFGVKEELDKHRMCINVLRSNLFEINLSQGSATFKCPKIPKDTDARIKVRRDPQNANKKQKIFGYNLVLIIDYNKRNEKLTNDALRERGYDQNGWPFAPCGLPTKPNGFDRKHQRHTFCCFKQCFDLKVTGIKNIQKDYDIGACPHAKRKKGYSKHTYIKDNPRLVNEIPRGTKRFKQIQQYRSASERVNSVIKEDLKILNKPIVYNKQRADILAQIAAIVLLLYRAFSFIIKISILFSKYRSSKDPAIAKQLQPHHVPKSILSLIQRE
jgi:hypothetical protein